MEWCYQVFGPLQSPTGSEECRKRRNEFVPALRLKEVRAPLLCRLSPHEAKTKKSAAKDSLLLPPPPNAGRHSPRSPRALSPSRTHDAKWHRDGFFLAPSHSRSLLLNYGSNASVGEAEANAEGFLEGGGDGAECPPCRAGIWVFRHSGCQAGDQKWTIPVHKEEEWSIVCAWSF